MAPGAFSPPFTGQPSTGEGWVPSNQVPSPPLQHLVILMKETDRVFSLGLGPLPGVTRQGGGVLGKCSYWNLGALW